MRPSAIVRGESQRLNESHPLETTAGGLELPLFSAPAIAAATQAQTWPNKAWISKIIQFGAAQVVVQVMGFASGILLVRSLDKSEYALLTIFGMMQGTMNLLADNGVSMALMAEGGRVCRDRAALGRVIAAALSIRRILGAITMVVMVPVSYRLLRESGATTASAVLLLVCLVLALHFVLVSGVLAVVPRLLGQVARLRNLDLLLAAGRLVLLVAVAGLLFLNAEAAAVVAVLATAAQYWLLRRWTAQDVDLHATGSAVERAAILKVVLRMTPNTLFYCVQGQLTLWLVSVFATASDVADVGALGRIAVVFAVFNSVLGAIIAPAFARIQDPARLRHLYATVMAGFTGLCALALLVTALFPGQLLWLLGSQYAHLQGELLLMVGVTLLAAMAGTMFSLNAARAWVDVAWIEIPLRIGLQILLFQYFDVTSVCGVLWIALLSQLSPLAVNVLLSLRGFRSLAATTSGASVAATT